MKRSDTVMKRLRGRIHLTAIMSIALLLGFPFPALPGPIPSRATNYVSPGTIDSTVINAEKLRTSLLTFGWSHDQLRVILERASPEDMHQLAAHLEQLKAAGGTRNRVWTVVAIVILVLAILLLASENALRHQHFVSGN